MERHLYSRGKLRKTKTDIPPEIGVEIKYRQRYSHREIKYINRDKITFSEIYECCKIYLNYPSLGVY